MSSSQILFVFNISRARSFHMLRLQLVSRLKRQVLSNLIAESLTLSLNFSLDSKLQLGYKKQCECGTCVDSSTGVTLSQGEILHYNISTNNNCPNLNNGDNPCFLCKNSEFGLLLASIYYMCDGTDNCFDGGGGSDESTDFCPNGKPVSPIILFGLATGLENSLFSLTNSD